MLRRQPTDHIVEKMSSLSISTSSLKPRFDILIPKREDPATAIGNRQRASKSIYAPSPSSPSFGKTAKDFGAVGDHLPSPRTLSFSSKRLPDVDQDLGEESIQVPLDTCSKTRSPLADLVRNSIADEGPHSLPPGEPAELLVAPLWKRLGLPFGSTYRVNPGSYIPISPGDSLDPPEYQLPIGVRPSLFSISRSLILE